MKMLQVSNKLCTVLLLLSEFSYTYGKSLHNINESAALLAAVEQPISVQIIYWKSVMWRFNDCHYACLKAWHMSEPYNTGELCVYILYLLWGNKDKT